jgi:dephospho-CoA kinase
VVIDNSGTRADLERQVARLWQRLMSFSGDSATGDEIPS